MLIMLIILIIIVIVIIIMTLVIMITKMMMMMIGEGASAGGPALRAQRRGRRGVPSSAFHRVMMYMRSLLGWLETRLAQNTLSYLEQALITLTYITT